MLLTTMVSLVGALEDDDRRANFEHQSKFISRPSSLRTEALSSYHPVRTHSRHISIAR